MTYEKSMRLGNVLEEGGVYPDWVLPVDYICVIEEPLRKAALFVPIFQHMVKSTLFYPLGWHPWPSLIGYHVVYSSNWP